MGSLAKAYRKFATELIHRAEVDFILCYDAPKIYPPWPFLVSEGGRFLLESLDFVPEEVERDWLKKAKEFDNLVDGGTWEEIRAWQRDYFPACTTILHAWKRQQGGE